MDRIINNPFKDIHNETILDTTRPVLLRILLSNKEIYVLQLGYNLQEYIIKNEKLYRKRGLLSSELLGDIVGFEVL